jgi:hypothetical protein
MKNVPVKSLPALAMWQTELSKSPPGDEVIEHEMLELLSCPLPSLTKTVAPGATELTGEPSCVRLNTRTGVASTVKATDALSPLSPVTVTVFDP